MSTETTNHGIPYLPAGTTDPSAGVNDALDVIDAVLVPRVISMSLTAPPGSPADGDLYIVAASGATGAWASLEDHLVRYVLDGTFWKSYAPGSQVALVLNQVDDGLYRFGGGSPAGWTLAAGIVDAPLDGSQYIRKDGDWQLASLAGLTVEDEGSPAQSLAPTTLIIGNGLTLTDESGGIARIEKAADTANAFAYAQSITGAAQSVTDTYADFLEGSSLTTQADSATVLLSATIAGTKVTTGTVYVEIYWNGSVIAAIAQSATGGFNFTIAARAVVTGVAAGSHAFKTQIKIDSGSAIVGGSSLGSILTAQQMA